MSAPSLSSLSKPCRLSRGAHRLPIDAGHGCLIEHQQGGHPGADRDGEVRRGDLLDIELDHHVFGDLPAFGGTILQAVETVLHLGNAAFEPGGQGFIGECRADNGRDDLMQVGQALDRIGEGLFIDLRVFRADPVSDGAVGNGGKFEGHGFKLQIVNTLDRPKGRPTPHAVSGNLIGSS